MADDPDPDPDSGSAEPPAAIPDDPPAATPADPPAGHSRRVVSYVRTDGDITAADDNSSPEDRALDGLTHINLAFAVPKFDRAGQYGGVFFTRPKADQNDPRDYSMTEDDATGAHIARLVAAAHAKGIKVEASFMGADASTDTVVNQFIGKPLAQTVAGDLVKLVKRYGLDGVDIDLEGPAIDANYTSFVLQVEQELSSEFGEGQELLTAALGPWNQETNLVPDDVLPHVSFLNLMSYDHPLDDHIKQEHSTFQDAQSNVQYWNVQRGVPVDQIVLGMPFYGYCWDNDNVQTQLDYRAIVAAHPEAPDSDTVQSADAWCTYNGRATIQQKATYGAQQLGGVMVWAIGDDDDQGTLYSALRAGLDAP